MKVAFGGGKRLDVTKTYKSVADMFVKRVEATPDKPAYKFPTGETSWGSLSWREAGDRVRALAMGLVSLGLSSEERCAIISATRIDWILADLAILCGGGATTTIYPNNTPEDCVYIINDSGTRYVFAEDNEQIEKLVEVKDQIPNVKKVITFDGTAGHDDWVITMPTLEELGKKHVAENLELYDEIVQGVKSDQLATLIYTSGTTGKPKGVELIHDCWVFEGEAIANLNLITIEDHQYLWLPLSHSFGKVLEAAQLHIGFPTTVDGRIPKLVENLAVVKPTWMAAAPRIFEKVYNKVVTGAAESKVKYQIFTWAVKVGKEVSRLRQNRREPEGLLALKYAVADKLVFSKLRARFGGKLRFFISGSAPLSSEIAEFFHAAGILILEGYGLTESSAASFVNRTDTFAFGTVGPPLDGVEVKIAEEDGEILLRGRGIMRGYHNLDETTKETLDEEKWLHTGDIGELTPAGLLRITDRKKDLIKTSGGKYIAPQKLEGQLKALCPYISQVVVHGDRRNFCTALVTLDEESIPKWAEDNGLGGRPIADLAQAAPVNGMVQKAFDELNKDLAKYETVKKFAILEKDFTVEDGLLTASLKVKRKVVEKQYQSVLDGFYEGSLRQV